MPHSPTIVGGGDVVDALGLQKHRGRPRTPPELESSQSLDSPSAESPLTPPRLTPGRGARFGAGSPRQRQLFSPFSPQKTTEGFSRPEDNDEDGSFSAGPGNYTHARYEDRPLDSRTILVDRLSELLDRLETGEALEDDALYTMHTQVDAMEGVLYIASKSKTPSIKSPSQRSAAYVDWQGRQGDGRASFRSGGSSPAWIRSGVSQQNSPSLSKPGASSHSVRARAQALGKAVNQSSMEGGSDEQCSTESRTLEKERSRVPSKVVDQIVQEAETLRKDMAKVMKNLQRRREEADASHLHDILIERLEVAARRIIQLEATVAELAAAREDQIKSNESELNFLRIGLRGIEIQALKYEDADPVLVRRIENWKKDWAGLRSKWTDKASRKAATRSSESILEAVAADHHDFPTEVPHLVRR